MADEGKPTGTQRLLANLIARDSASDEREERDRAAERATAERQIVLWSRVALAELLVILVLVAGVLGVGVSGRIPGIGAIAIQADEAPALPPDRDGEVEP